MCKYIINYLSIYHNALGIHTSKRSQRIFLSVSGYALQCDDVTDTPDTFPSVSWHARIGNQHNLVCRVSWHVIFIFILPQLCNDDYINVRLNENCSFRAFRNVVWGHVYILYPPFIICISPIFLSFNNLSFHINSRAIH